MKHGEKVPSKKPAVNGNVPAASKDKQDGLDYRELLEEYLDKEVELSNISFEHADNGDFWEQRLRAEWIEDALATIAKIEQANLRLISSVDGSFRPILVTKKTTLKDEIETFNNLYVNLHYEWSKDPYNDLPIGTWLFAVEPKSGAENNEVPFGWFTDKTWSEQIISFHENNVSLHKKQLGLYFEPLSAIGFARLLQHDPELSPGKFGWYNFIGMEEQNELYPYGNVRDNRPLWSAYDAEQGSHCAVLCLVRSK